jgi:hypothetical protein
LKIREAYLCDARERDLSPLQITHNQVEFVPERSLTSIRMII